MIHFQRLELNNTFTPPEQRKNYEIMPLSREKFNIHLIV